MNTDHIRVYSDGGGKIEAMDAAERFALYHRLEARDANCIRLLAEELLGMVSGIIGHFEGDFWLESEGDEFRIRLRADTYMDKNIRKELMSLSTSGKNESSISFLGMLGRMLGHMILDEGAGEEMTGPAFYGAMGAPTADALSASDYEWSYLAWKSDSSQKTEDWDELEKSIIIKLADDVRVGVRGDTAELTIVKRIPNVG
ncbi:MAG: hypothetical protein IK115_09745 [Lachnospiraceae bacterium]|nr:hypothetical protein [Lachnospiraceae bacterium]